MPAGLDPGPCCVGAQKGLDFAPWAARLMAGRGSGQPRFTGLGREKPQLSLPPFSPFEISFSFAFFP